MSPTIEAFNKFAMARKLFRQTASDFFTGDVIPVLMVNHRHRVLVMSKAASYQSNQMYLRDNCRGLVFPTTLPVSYGKLLPYTRKEDWLMYKLQATVPLADIANAIVAKFKYRVVGRLGSYEETRQQKSPIGVFKVYSEDTSVVRYVHTSIDTCEAEIARKAKRPLVNEAKYPLTARQMATRFKGWELERSKFLASKNLKVTLVEQIPFDKEAVTLMLGKSRRLNREAIQQLKE